MTKSSRVIALDILKAFAVLVVLNSHLDPAYAKFDFLGTGGAIGDSLFFFCSGFMLFQGRSIRFDNFMKKRVARIYPTVIIVAIVGALLFGRNDNIISILLSGGGWFVSCIMIYYVILWFIKRFGLNHLKLIWILLSAVIVLWYYYLFDNEGEVSLYGANYFKWVFFFSSMLLGAQIGLQPQKYKFNNWVIPKLILCIVLWYSFMIFPNSVHLFVDFQYVSVVPLLGITYYFYLFCCAPFWKVIYEHRIIGQIIFIIGGICLECYLIQGFFITDKLNWIFPINILLIVAFILLISYAVNYLSGVFSATFRREDYKWSDYFLRKPTIKVRK